MTVFGYIRLSRADDRRPASLAADRARLDAGLAAYLARGYSAGEVVTDDARQFRKPVAARPGGFRVGRLAKRGDVILVPSAVRLARSVAELRDTLERWHGAGVVGVLLDLRLDYSTPEARAVVATMEAGAHLDKSLGRFAIVNDRTDDENRTVNRWGLAVRANRGTIVPGEFELIARCAAWHAAGATYVQIAGHLTRTGVPQPERLRKRNRIHRPRPWQPDQVRKMIRSYHVVAGLLARGAVKAPKGWTPPAAEPAPLA